HGLEELVVVEGGVALAEVEGEEQVDPLVAEAGRRVDGGERDEAAGDEAGLLLQLPAGAELPVLSGALRPTRRHLEQFAAGRVAVLADEHDAWVGRGRVVEHREDGRGAGVPDELELAGRAVREADGVDGEVHDAPPVDRAPGNEPRRGRDTGFLVHSPGLSGCSGVRGPPSSPRRSAVRWAPGAGSGVQARPHSTRWTSTGPTPRVRSGSVICSASPTTTMARRSLRRWVRATRSTSSAVTVA